MDEANRLSPPDLSAPWKTAEITYPPALRTGNAQVPVAEVEPLTKLIAQLPDGVELPAGIADTVTLSPLAGMPAVDDTFTDTGIALP
ncbi:MAG TPA: hypothetical protein VGH31_01790 [Acidimicrobiales bacterium]